MALGWTHSAKRPFQHHQTSVGLEPPGEEETRAPKTDLETQPHARTENIEFDLGGSQADRQRPQKVEDDSRGPRRKEA